jgi:hypothetical protein
VLCRIDLCDFESSLLEAALQRLSWSQIFAGE